MVPSSQKTDKGRSNGVSLDIVDGLRATRIADAPLPNIKTKNLDVVTEYAKTKHKRAASFVVIGDYDYVNVGYEWR